MQIVCPAFLFKVINKYKRLLTVNFVELKPEKYIYCGKTYTNRRYISDCKKYLITSDDGFNYAMIHAAKANGKGMNITNEFCHKHNRHGYPIYTFNDAKERLEKAISDGLIDTQFVFEVHESQFKKR